MKYTKKILIITVVSVLMLSTVACSKKDNLGTINNDQTQELLNKEQADVETTSDEYEFYEVSMSATLKSHTDTELVFNNDEIGEFIVNVNENLDLPELKDGKNYLITYDGSMTSSLPPILFNVSEITLNE